MGAIPVCITQPHRYVTNVDGINLGVPNLFGDNFSGLDFDYALQEINSVMYFNFESFMQLKGYILPNLSDVSTESHL